MIDWMADDPMLTRRLEAYADLRLSPALTASSRLRARVLAVAHRQAALARADAALSVLPVPGTATGGRPFAGPWRDASAGHGRGRGRNWQRAAGVVLAASLGASLVSGGAFAVRPGGPLYDMRLWTETLTLPRDPSARALAELGRLQARLHEIEAASRSGDAAGATAALAAYEGIVDQATAAALLAGDDVATAVLETGVGRNVEVLQTLVARVPVHARAAIGHALDAAIARSADAIDRIGAGRPGSGRGGGDGRGPAVTHPTQAPRATKAPTARPTPEPVSTATPKPKQTHKATAEPTATAEPAATAEPTATPDDTPKPRENQGGPKQDASPDPAPSPDPDGGGG